MKLSDDTLICLGEILAGKRDSHNSEIYKLQHDHLGGLVLHNWYFLFSSQVLASREIELSVAIDETTSIDECHAKKSDTASITPLRINGSEAERIVAVPLTGRKPIASMIVRWGDPPQIVQDDWRQQLNAHPGRQEILFFLISEDGLLSKVPGIERLEESVDEDLAQLDQSWKTVQWPWERDVANLSLVRKKPPKKRSPRQRGPLLLIGGSIAGIFFAGMLLAIFWPSDGRLTNSSTIPQTHSIAVASALRDNDFLADIAPIGEAKTTNSHEVATVDLESLEKIDFKQDSLDEMKELLAPSQDFTKLLVQGTFGDSILSNKIVESSLSSSAEMTLNQIIESEPAGAADAPTSESPALTKPEDSQQNEGSVSLNLDAGIERTLLLSDSKIKDRIAIGQKLLSKDGMCRATLQMQTENSKPVATVVPEGIMSILGNGTSSWTIGMEDSDPELVVQFQSKPGRRWDLLVLIGFREEKTQTPRLLAPGNAKHVVNQLIAAKQSVLGLLEQNQLARDSGLRGFDLYEQRRQLQRQEKELDKALERWKVIEKLSYLVFDQAKLHVTLELISPN